MKHQQFFATFFTPNRSGWLRLGAPVALAAVFTALALLLPVLLGTAVVLPIPAQAANGLTIAKYVSAQAVAPGGTITYTLRVTNNTGVALTDVTITDTVPANTLCTNMQAPAEWFVTQGLCLKRNPSATAVAWNLPAPAGFLGGVIAPGAVVDLVYSVQVNKPLADGTKIVNAASSYGIKVISPTASFYDDSGLTTVTTTVTAPAWQISKTASPTPTVEAGSPLVYTLTFTNNGALATSGLYTVTDAVPANTAFVSASDSGSESGGVVRWQFSTPLAPNASRSVNFTVNVAQPLADGLKLVNHTYAITGGSAFDPASGSPVTVTVSAPVTMTVVKQDAPDPVQAGARLVYTLTVANSPASKGPADNVLVTDTVPANTFFEGAGISGGSAVITAPVVGGTGVVTWAVTSPNPLPVGQSVVLTMAVRVNSPLPNGTLLFNNAYGATAANALRPTAGASVQTTVASSPNVTFTKRVQPQSLGYNQPVTYTIVITNSGNESALAVPFTDAVQAPDFSLSTPTWSIPVITGTNLAGQPGVVTYTLGATSGATSGTFPNYLTATVRGQRLSIGPVAPVTVVGQANLQISKRAHAAQVIAGTPITYTITLTNAPGSDTINVVVTDTFTAGSVAAVTPSRGTCSGSGPVVCQISSFTNTETITLRLNTSPVFSNVLTNTVVITTAVPGVTDGSPLDNTDLVTVTVYRPMADLEVTKTAAKTQILAGQQITYTLTVTNHGPTAVSPVLTDTFAPSFPTVQWVDSSPSPSDLGFTYVAWRNLPVLNSGQSATVVVTFTTAASYAGLLTNTAVVTFNSAAAGFIDPGPGPNTDQVITPVQPPTADLEISKTTAFTEVFAGQPITYTLTITNHGADTVGVVVTDTFLPVGGAVAGVTCTNGCSYAGGNTVVWNSLPVLAGGQQRSMVLTFTTSTAYSGLLTNTAVITFSGANPYAVDPGPSPNTDRVSTPVRQLQADLRLTKARIGGSGLIQRGQPITYLLTIFNNGPDRVTVVVTDTFSNAALQSYSTAYPGAVCTPTVIGGGGRLVCTLPNFLGTATITLTVSTAASDILSMVLNNAQVAAAVFVVDNPNDNTGAVNVGFQTTPVLMLTKTAAPAAGASVRPGDTIVYNVQVTNLPTATAAASGVSMVDVLPGGVGLVRVSTNGSHSTTGLTHTFTMPSLGIGASLTATLEVTVTAATSGTMLINNARASYSAGSAGTALVSHRVITGTATAGKVYLPIIMKNLSLLPNLISSVSVNTASNPPLVTVIITNTGNSAVSEPFWVDFYVNPSQPPSTLTGADRRWQRVKTIDRGIAWPVNTVLAANGGSVTLTSLGGFDINQTRWSALPAGTYNFYAFADSFDNNDPQGAIYVEVPESNESDNESSQLGVGVSGLGVSAAEPETESVYPPRE